MKKVVIAIVATLFSTLAAAQTGGVPPTQAPAGAPGKLETPKQMKADKAAAATPATPAADKPTTPEGKKAARKAKRAAKVGDKPID